MGGENGLVPRHGHEPVRHERRSHGGHAGREGQAARSGPGRRHCWDTTHGVRLARVTADLCQDRRGHGSAGVGNAAQQRGTGRGVGARRTSRPSRGGPAPLPRTISHHRGGEEEGRRGGTGRDVGSPTRTQGPCHVRTREGLHRGGRGAARGRALPHRLTCNSGGGSKARERSGPLSSGRVVGSFRCQRSHPPAPSRQCTVTPYRLYQ
mmetsp:Transcript_2729/g.7522  ORF Transcript_2729/g.7522 Transcript_2729/m.7522 type:complete len:208 (-) Transcript_2729:40-663(-)